MMMRPHLGSGWSFPIRPVGGRLAWASGDDKIEQAIGLVLATAPGERVMLPEFGAGLRRWVFQANSPVTHRAIEAAVRDALVAWEPRIELRGVRAGASPSEPQVVLIEIDYIVRRTNAFYNRVYPFYVGERT